MNAAEAMRDIENGRVHWPSDVLTLLVELWAERAHDLPPGQRPKERTSAEEIILKKLEAM